MSKANKGLGCANLLKTLVIAVVAILQSAVSLY